MAGEAFGTAALRRIEWLTLVLGGAGAAWAGWRWGWRGSAGLAIGALVSWINFRWLKSTVAALADAVFATGNPASRPAVVLRFITRFALIALVTYVIFTSYPVAFHGFLGGLFVPVLAIFMEAAYVVLAAVRPSTGS